MPIWMKYEEAEARLSYHDVNEVSKCVMQLIEDNHDEALVELRRCES